MLVSMRTHRIQTLNRIFIMKCHLTSIRMAMMAITNETRDSNFWRGCGEKGTLVHCWWEWKLV